MVRSIRRGGVHRNRERWSHGINLDVEALRIAVPGRVRGIDRNGVQPIREWNHGSIGVAYGRASIHTILGGQGPAGGIGDMNCGVHGRGVPAVYAERSVGREGDQRRGLVDLERMLDLEGQRIQRGAIACLIGGSEEDTVWLPSLETVNPAPEVHAPPSSW